MVAGRAQEARESLIRSVEECGSKLAAAECKVAEASAAEDRSGQMLAKLSVSAQPSFASYCRILETGSKSIQSKATSCIAKMSKPHAFASFMLQFRHQWRFCPKTAMAYLCKYKRKQGAAHVQ